MCYKCEKNKYYTEGRLTYDELVTKEAVKDFTENIIEQLEELKTKRFVSGITSDPYEFGACHAIDIAIDVIRKAV